MISEGPPCAKPSAPSVSASLERISQSGFEVPIGLIARRKRRTLPSRLVVVPSTSAKLETGSTTSAILPASGGRKRSCTTVNFASQLPRQRSSPIR
jgi:hypothetical protein